MPESAPKGVDRVKVEVDYLKYIQAYKLLQETPHHRPPQLEKAMELLKAALKK